jgi:hypothetical protein
VSWEPLDALLRPLLQDLVSPVRALLASTGLGGRNLESQLLLVDGKADIGGFVTTQLLVALIIAAWPFLLSLSLGWALGPSTTVFSRAMLPVIVRFQTSRLTRLSSSIAC